MDKTERLLQLTAHPELCSDEELQQLLADDECRSLYEAMRLSADASAMDDAKARLADGLKEEEWERLKNNLTQGSPRRERSVLFKMAASIIGVLMLGGIAYAAIAYLTSDPSPKETEVYAASPESTEAGSGHTSALESGAEEESFHVFSNVTLDTIAIELATYYHREAVIRDKKAHDVRLYYKWNMKEDIDAVIADLNHFDHVNLTLEADQLIVK
ncbi:MAG: DUF4974 domain-containing protein [Prevotella sp.]|nr:DUF4974 domain-containing protein [Prevotella sp.]